MLKTILVLVMLGGLLKSCISAPTALSPSPAQSPMLQESPVATPVNSRAELTDRLHQSWQAYRQRFIQADGRVIDREANDRSTSEGQAYAMLRAVWIDDRDTFDRVLQWAETNLRRNLDSSADQLWCWKWGRQDNGSWGPIDRNFASDGDIDAITALIWAAKRWNHPPYLVLAQQKLQDLWNLATLPGATGRYLLPGPRSAFQPQSAQVYLNPSYFAPYAFRLFAQVDPDRDWLSLVDSSYQVLADATPLSAIGLPSDWIALNLTTGKVTPIAASNKALQSRYGFDAYRVWWRLALDATWFHEPRARSYLQQQLQPLQQQWQANQYLPAIIDLKGRPVANYESTAQYAMLYPALELIDPSTASAIYQQKLRSTYHNGFWDNDSAYYVQNLSWMGLFPVAALPGDWFHP